MILVMKMNNIRWNDFQIGGDNGIFSITSSTSEIDKNKLNQKPGNIPYVTRSELNNGIDMFVTKDQEEKYQINKGNVITIGLDTQTVFYQPTDFFTGQNIQILNHKRMNKYIAYFLIPLLKVQMEKFNWGGNGATLKRLKNTRVMLPINNENRIYWEYMEKQGYEIYQSKRKKILLYLTDKYNQLAKEIDNIEVSNWDKLSWNSFEIQEIAEVFSGQDIYAQERIEGNIPYVTAGASNNGIGYFVSNENKTLSSDIISVNRNGAVGQAFYHPYEALFGNDTRRVIPNYRNKYSSLFLTYMITLQKEKYDYGLKMGTKRLKKQKILLPVTNENKIDWQYMKKLMKQIELEQIRKIKNHLVG
ncbi:restriction endonuclease subunit S [Oceanobacillus sojae]|uniref:restriction endonuclease subunit S n=1 Tax=Oceanobacillus sojae TaxID=582851 RepID=UPI0020C9C4C4|nr:restriction endonuclease subunit S [Oceanobacillus sojae]